MLARRAIYCCLAATLAALTFACGPGEGPPFPPEGTPVPPGTLVTNWRQIPDTWPTPNIPLVLPPDGTVVRRLPNGRLDGLPGVGFHLGLPHGDEAYAPPDVTDLVFYLDGRD